MGKFFRAKDANPGDPAKWRRPLWTASLFALSAVTAMTAPANASTPDTDVRGASEKARGETVAAPPVGQQGVPDVAAGQTTAGDSSGNENKVQDIVVTARRVSERLQDIPASVAAISGDQVGRMTSLNDIQSLVSGVTFKSQGPVAIVGIRGFGNRPILTGANTTVGIFQDGVFLAPFLNALTSRIDVARIEVAKGPQSTLYGRSSYAGAINIVTNDPTSMLTGYIEGGAGGSSAHSEFLWHAQGVISGPITDTLSARVFVLHEKRDGYTYDPITDYRGYGYDRTVGRIKLMWKPTDDLTVRLSGTLMHDNSPRGEVHSGKILPPLGQRTAFGNPLFVPTYVTGPDIWRGSFARPQLGKINGQQGTLDVRYQTSVGELALLSDYTHSDTYIRALATATAADVVDSYGVTDEKRFSQEIRLSNKIDRFSYLLGLYYLNTDFKSGDPGATIDLNAPFAMFYPGSAPYDLGNTQAIYQPGYTKTNAYAAFAQVGYDVTDRLNLTVGIREARDRLKGTASSTTLQRTGALVTTVPTTFRKVKFDATTGSANLSYKFSPDILAYASYSRGDSPGGFNAGAAALINFEPQKVNAFEIGLKSKLLDRHLQFNLALFNNDYLNLQFFQAIVLNGIATQVQLNAAKARGRGLDLDTIAVLSSNWRMGLQYTYQKSKITNYNIPAPPAPQVSYAGVPLVRSPKHSVNGSVTYLHDIGPGRFQLTAEENYSSSYNNDYTGVPAGTAYPGRPGVPAGVTTTQVLGLFRTPGVAITNLTASYAFGKWEVSGFVRNLFNHQYIVALTALDPFSYANETPGEPRTFEANLRYKF